MHNNEFEILYNLAENNDLYSVRRILDYYFNNKNEDYFQDETINLDSEKILNYINLLIENNDSNAMTLLGGLYYDGIDGIVEQDYSKAEYWYNEASNKKPLDVYNINPDALNNLGYVYSYGRTNNKDFKKAFYYFGKAACLGHPNAMYKIGDMYKYGNYVDKNNDKAFYWYKNAYTHAENNDYIIASVALRLGESYLYGYGTEISLLKSLKYLQIAERRMYKMVIIKQIPSNSMYIDKPLKNVQNLLKIVHDELTKLL